MEKGWGWECSDEAAPPFPLATCCPGEESCDQFLPESPPHGSLEQTQMLQEEMLSQKGLLGKESVKGMGLLAGTPVPCFSLCCLQVLLIDPSLSFFLHSLLSKGLYSLYKEKQSPGNDV